MDIEKIVYFKIGEKVPENVHQKFVSLYQGSYTESVLLKQVYQAWKWGMGKFYPSI